MTEQQDGATRDGTRQGERIAIVGDRPFLPSRGGVERISDTLTKTLLANGFVVFHYSLTPCEGETKPSAPLHTAPKPDRSSPGVLADYQDFLRRHEITTVLIQDGQSETISLTLATGNPHIRLIACIHNTPLWDYTCLWRSRISSLRITSLSKLRKRVSRILFYWHHKRRSLRLWTKHYRLLANSGAELILLSEHFYGDLALTGVDFGERLHAIPNINTYPEPVSVNWDAKEKELLFVGRMDNVQKQISLLLHIWKRVAPQAPDWALTIVGGGPDEEYLKQLAVRLKLPRVRFAGRCDPTPYYRRASILCMTSLFEGFGLVLTEAQQQGVATISFESYASVRDIIEDAVNGVLVTPFKQREYAEKLLQLMRDDEYRLRLAHRARETVQRFNADVILPRWISYLRQTPERRDQEARSNSPEPH